MKKIQRSKIHAITMSVLLSVLSALPLFVQACNVNTTGDARDVTVGAFTVKVPSDWQPFTASESDQLRRQFVSQSEEIYSQYSSETPDPAKSVYIAAFHIVGDAGTFAIVSFTIPPQSDLVNLLKNQAEEKAKWGIQQGYIKKYLGIVPVDDQSLSGFYIKSIGTEGDVQVSGGLEHKKLKNTLVQLTLLCPKSWDELKATSILTSVLESVKLKERITAEAQAQPDQLSRQEANAANAFGTETSTDFGRDIIMDKKNGLIWQRDTIDGIDYGSAVAYCEKLKLAGRSDWRLPSKDELISGFEVLPHHEGYSQNKTFVHWTSTETPSGYVDVVMRNVNTSCGVLEREKTWKPGGATIGARCVCDAK